VRTHDDAAGTHQAHIAVGRQRRELGEAALQLLQLCERLQMDGISKFSVQLNQW